MSALRLRGTTRPRSASALIGVTILIALGCGQRGPSSSPSAAPPPTPTASAATSASPSPASSAAIDAIYDEIEAQVVAIRDLRPEQEVARQSIDKAELRQIITGMFDENSPPGYVAASDRLYKALGLIPADADLRELNLELLSGGVAGFYRNDEDKLYIVSRTGLPGVLERITFAHEYDHALQDQHTTVFTDQKGILDQSDRILARLAIYEGDATLLMSLWALANFTPEDLPELLAVSSNPEQQQMLDRMPAILRETLLFPYTGGTGFVQAAHTGGGWPAVDAFYDRMPESTEQILHPEAYRANESPVKVALPDDLAAELGAGWSVPLQDTFGELQFGIWLRNAGIEAATAAAAAEGWGGDRLAVVEGPAGAWGVVIETSWDSQADAAAFADAALVAVDGLTDEARVSAPAGNDVSILIASDSDTLLALDVIFGATGV